MGGTQQKNNSHKKKPVDRVPVILAVVLLTAAAAIGGIFLAGRLKDDSGKSTAPEVSTAKVTDTASDMPEHITIDMCPMEAIFVTKKDGTIGRILVGILQCERGRLDYVDIPVEITYTMSPELYSKLTPGNTELPQTVLLSKLYDYYGNDRAYEAGRRIAGEILFRQVKYYTIVSEEEFSKYIIEDNDGTEAGLRLAISSEDARSGDYETAGSVKGLLETGIENVVTSWSEFERLRYLEVYEQLTTEDVRFWRVPVTKHNESTEYNAAETATVMYNIFY